MPQPARDEVLAFLSVICEVDHELRRVSKNVQRTIGVTGPQRLVIRALGRKPGLSPGDLAQALRLHPSTMTGLLARLEAARVIVRSRDPSDGRRQSLALTARGRALDVDASGTVEDAATIALARMKSSARKDAAALLTSLAAALREIHGADDDDTDARPAAGAVARGRRGSVKRARHGMKAKGKPRRTA